MRRAGAGRWLALLTLCLSAAAPAAEFVFERVQVGLQGEVILIDADIRYTLNETVLEAMDNGVPLTFELHVKLRRDDAWIWERDEIDTRLRSVLRYHPLSGVYELRDLQGAATESFATRDAALSALGRIRDYPISRLDQLESGANYKLRMQTYLDIDALPLPLRPKAYISPAWGLESKTWEWRLQP